MSEVFVVKDEEDVVEEKVEIVEEVVVFFDRS